MIPLHTRSSLQPSESAATRRIKEEGWTGAARVLSSHSTILEKTSKRLSFSPRLTARPKVRAIVAVELMTLQLQLHRRKWLPRYLLTSFHSTIKRVQSRCHSLHRSLSSPRCCRAKHQGKVRLETAEEEERKSPWLWY